MYLSIDGADRWIAINRGITDLNIISLASTSEGYILAGTEGNRIYITFNNGFSWTPFHPQGFAQAPVRSIALATEGQIFVTTYGEGVLRSTSWPDMLLDVTPEDLPTEAALSQNHPNPFNPETAISYQLSAVSRVTLKVYNLLGQEVATLVHKTQIPGTYVTRWNAMGLPSGV